VNWVDYKDHVERADPDQFAAELLQQAGTGSVWLVSSTGYLPFSDKCERILGALSSARGAGQPLVVADADTFEHMGLVRFAP
jgi:hypothetical protein